MSLPNYVVNFDEIEDLLIENEIDFELEDRITFKDLRGQIFKKTFPIRNLKEGSNIIKLKHEGLGLPTRWEIRTITDINLEGEISVGRKAPSSFLLRENLNRSVHTTFSSFFLFQDELEFDIKLGGVKVNELYLTVEYVMLDYEIGGGEDGSDN